MTQSFPAGETPDTQAKLTTLTGLHQQATTELAKLKSEVEDLTRRLSDSTNQSQLVIAEYTKEKTNLEMELRWAKQGREGAEKAEQRAKKELAEFYKFQDSGVCLLIFVVDLS
jgi:mitotic spindle assembly checkpoint protein MAD1